MRHTVRGIKNPERCPAPGQNAKRCTNISYVKGTLLPAIPKIRADKNPLNISLRPNPSPAVLAVNPIFRPLVYGTDGYAKVLGRYFWRHLFGPMLSGWLRINPAGYNVGNLCSKLLYLGIGKCYLSGHSSKVSFAAQQIAPAKARSRAKMKAIVKIIHIGLTVCVKKGISKPHWRLAS